MAVEEAVKRLLYMLGSCLAGAVALSAPRVLGLLLTRLGADPQVHFPPTHRPTKPAPRLLPRRLHSPACPDILHHRRLRAALLA